LMSNETTSEELLNYYSRQVHVSIMHHFWHYIEV
jgi:hypothetical protein